MPADARNALGRALGPAKPWLPPRLQPPGTPPTRGDVHKARPHGRQAAQVLLHQLRHQRRRRGGRKYELADAAGGLLGLAPALGQRLQPQQLLQGGGLWVKGPGGEQAGRRR